MFCLNPGGALRSGVVSVSGGRGGEGGGRGLWPSWLWGDTSGSKIPFLSLRHPRNESRRLFGG